MFDDAAVAILAGGKASRLGGQNKALLEIDGRPILARQLDVLRWLFREILIVANDPEPYAHLGFPVVPDAVAGRGAPGGVHAALAAARSEWVFCLGCDMPFVRAGAIELLGGRRGGHEAVVPVKGEQPEPLFAFYRRALAPRFEARLRECEPSLRRLLADCDVDYVPEADFATVDPGLRSVTNVNSPDDLAKARG